MKHPCSTKRALFTSVLALMLCFAMLVGSTFAWFTDSVSSGTNQIIAGNLDIELYHSNKNDTEEKVTLDTILFDDVDSSLWEPNAIACEKLNVKNEGKLALKYKLTLNAMNATVIDDVSFASMLRVAVIEDVNYNYARDTIVSDENLVWNDLATFSLEGTLEENENKIYGIVIWWKPTVRDDLFNMKNENQGKTVSIDVGVQLVATQLDVESDSYGSDYDADLEYPSLSVPVKIPTGGASEDVKLSTEGMSVTVPTAVINSLPNEVTSIGLAYTTPVADAANSTLTYESVELVDQNGKAIDLAGNTGAALTVTIAVPTTFASNEFVFVYHNGELAGSGIVNANGELTYTVNHFCEVVISKELKGDTIEVGTGADLAALSNASLAGKTIKLVDDITIDNAVYLPAGVTLNGNGYEINGTIAANGDLTFAGNTTVTTFSAGISGNVITIGPGACLNITSGNRTTFGYGNTFNITGTLTDAKTADKTAVQPSLYIPAGISLTGYNGVTVNVTNAYIKVGNTSSKNSAATDTFTLNFTNSIAEFTNQFLLATPTSNKTPTFKMNVKDSILTTAAKLCIAAPDSELIFDNSAVTLGTYLRNSGKLTLQNGSSLTGATIQFGENGGNDGIITVDNSSLTITASSAGHALDGKGIGSIVLKNGASASITYYKDMAVSADNTSTITGTNLTPATPSETN